MMQNPQDLLKQLAYQQQQQQNTANVPKVPTPPPPQAPNWQANLQQLAQLRSRNPVTSPIPTGTPTMGREQFNEGVRQYDQSFAADQAHRQQQLSMQREGMGTQQTKLPASDPNAYADIQSRAINRVKQLTQQPGIVGNSSSLAMIEPSLQQQRAMDPQEAIRSVINDIWESNAQIGMSAKQMQELEQILYSYTGAKPAQEAEQEKPVMSFKDILSAYNNDAMTREAAQQMVDRYYPDVGYKF